MAGDLDAAISAYLQAKTHSDAAVDVMESAAERNASRIITLVRMRNLQDAVGRGVPLTLLTRVWRAKVMARPQ